MSHVHGNDGASTPVPPKADRLPPQNLDAERSVIGCALYLNEAADEALEIVQADDFYRQDHQDAWKAIGWLRTAGQPCDAITVSERMAQAGSHNAIEIFNWLTELAEAIPSAANARYHAQIVQQLASKRRLIEACAASLDDAYSNSFDRDELLGRAEERIFAIRDGVTSGQEVDPDAIVQQTGQRLEARMAGELCGLESGIEELDNLTNGFHPGQLIVLAARPSLGKSALAGNIASHLARVYGKSIYFVSLEMEAVEVMERIVVDAADVDYSRVRAGDPTCGEYERYQAMAGEAWLRRLFVDDAPIREISQLAARIRRARARHGVDLAIVDYLQLIDGEERRNETRQEQVAKISRRLKLLAKQLGIPILALSQLNRNVETRQDHRPYMADLRESGAIEQDADIVLLLHRPDFYNPNDEPGLAELIVAKNRNGATGAFMLRFLKSRLRFENPVDQLAASL